MELFTDLLLAEFYLAHQLAEKITLYLKPYPTFVSDAIYKDYERLLEFMKTGAELNELADKLQAHQENGRLLIESEPIFNLPLYFYDYPESFFSPYDLVLVKGDANYRRILGDKIIPVTDPQHPLTNYLKKPVLAIRSLKSELQCGLMEEQVEQLFKKDPQWLVNGRFGIFQFFDNQNNSF